MEHIPWEANSSSVTQGVLSILWYPKFHNRIHKSPPPFPILSQMNQISTLPFCCFMVLLTPRYFWWSLSFVQNLCMHFCPMSATWCAHLILLVSIIVMLFSEVYEVINNGNNNIICRGSFGDANSFRVCRLVVCYVVMYYRCFFYTAFRSYEVIINYIV
jgi:hypothetical protein